MIYSKKKNKKKDQFMIEDSILIGKKIIND